MLEEAVARRTARLYLLETDMSHIDIVFDGPPGPHGGRFIEVEDSRGRSITFGKWIQRDDSFWVLRVERIGTVLDLMELLVTQDRLQAQMGYPTGLGEKGFKENMLHVHVEVAEALMEVNFKPWKTEKKPIAFHKLATEMTDILQFWANAALCMGLTPGQLTEALRNKWEVNRKRMASGEVVTAQLDNVEK